jgi:tetratricopeptide (TPR) repeat protein
MKKIFILAMTISSILIVSCEKDVLEKRPLDGFSEAAVWSDAALAEGFVMSIYSNVIGGLYANQETDDWTDNVLPNEDNGGGRVVQASRIENTADYGWNQYGTIRKCNLTIAKLSDPANPIIPAVKTNLIAEAKTLRAMTYFWMARRFGGVMLVDKVLTQYDEFKLPRASEREIYNFIIKDLEEAAPGLNSSAAKGRLTKAAAQAFLTMAALQIGDYDKVIAAADAVETSSHSLDPNYKNMFNSFTGSVASPENILIYYKDKEKNSFIDTRMFRNLTNTTNGPKLRSDAVPQFYPTDDFQGWPLRWPSQELVDDYLFIEGGVAVKKTGTELNGTPSGQMWVNRDLRLEHTVVRDGATFSKSVFTFHKGGNMHYTSNPLSSWAMSKSGYMFRKWFYENEYIFYDLPVSFSEPILRLGEVYLNKAEAYGRKGNLAKAIEYMNKTRTVHGGLPALSGGASTEEFWRFYKIERHVELAMEDDRYWSLIRWARAENATSIPELNGYKLHCLDMLEDRITRVIESSYSEPMKFELPKRLFFPVPDGQRRENTNLSQNPGWN